MTNRIARFTQADIARALRGARAAGMVVGSLQIDEAGRIVIIPTVPTPAKPDSAEVELEHWRERHAGRHARTS